MTTEDKKKILKLKFTPKTEESEKTNKTEQAVSKNTQTDTHNNNNKTETTRLAIKGIPQIIKNINTQKSTNPKFFKKKTFIPEKNENKFAPKLQISSKKDENKFTNKKPYIKKDFNTNKPLLKPPVSLNFFSQHINQNTSLEKKTFDPTKKKKLNKKESSKPKININNNSINGKTFFGRIEDVTLEDPEYIKIKKDKKTQSTKQKIFIQKNIELENNITLKELAIKLSMKTEEILLQAKNIGFEDNENTLVDIDILEMIIESFGHIAIRKDMADKEKFAIYDIKIDNNTAIPRNPIVSIVGHVDHGKTSLLDKIRSTNLTKSEIGGITQRINAYSVKTKHGDITFIDTPGHSAFFNMRERGININDITILIISGIDGIQDQTEESIKHIKKTNTHFLIAVTKSDLPGYNVDKIKQDLTKYEIITKDYGGDIDLIEISSINGKNIDLLLQTLITYGELLELKYNKEANAIGIVIESKIYSKSGVSATLVIQQGSLKIGDYCISGTSFGKIKRIIDDHGNNIKIATAGNAVEILGFNNCLQPGAKFAITKNQSLINDLIKYQNQKNIKKEITIKPTNISSKPCLNLILKADSIGGLEALKIALKTLKTKFSTYKIITNSIGAIKDSDLEIAKISNATIVNYNTTLDKLTEHKAQKEKIKIISNKIIYKIIEEIDQNLTKLIKLIEKEVYVGTAIVLKIFKSSKIGNISGCNVKDGQIIKNGIAKIYRKDKIVFEGKIQSLYRAKNEAKEIKTGFDCGIYTGFNEIKEEDIIKCYQIEYEMPVE